MGCICVASRLALRPGDEVRSGKDTDSLCPDRMILFLQQSSVEWASSLWLRVVQEVDPYFQRTVRGEHSLSLVLYPCRDYDKMEVVHVVDLTNWDV